MRRGPARFGLAPRAQRTAAMNRLRHRDPWTRETCEHPPDLRLLCAVPPGIDVTVIGGENDDLARQIHGVQPLQRLGIHAIDRRPILRRRGSKRASLRRIAHRLRARDALQGDGGTPRPRRGDGVRAARAYRRAVARGGHRRRRFAIRVRDAPPRLAAVMPRPAFTRPSSRPILAGRLVRTSTPRSR